MKEKACNWDGNINQIPMVVSIERCNEMLQLPESACGEEYVYLGGEVEDFSWEVLIDEIQRTEYSLAIASGLISGVLDSIFVKEFSFESGSFWGKEKVEKFVMFAAKNVDIFLKGHKAYEGDDLVGAIRFLEKNFGLVSDLVKNDFGGGLQHHSRYFSSCECFWINLFSYCTI